MEDRISLQDAQVHHRMLNFVSTEWSCVSTSTAPSQNKLPYPNQQVPQIRSEKHLEWGNMFCHIVTLFRRSFYKDQHSQLIRGPCASEGFVTLKNATIHRWWWPLHSASCCLHRGCHTGRIWFWSFLLCFTDLHSQFTHLCVLDFQNVLLIGKVTR